MMVASWAMYMFCQSNATAKVCTVKQALKSLFVAHSKIVLPKPQDSKLPNSNKDVITAHHAVPSHSSHDNRLSCTSLSTFLPLPFHSLCTWLSHGQQHAQSLKETFLLPKARAYAHPVGLVKCWCKSEICYLFWLDIKLINDPHDDSKWDNSTLWHPMAMGT